MSRYVESIPNTHQDNDSIAKPGICAQNNVRALSLEPKETKKEKKRRKRKNILAQGSSSSKQRHAAQRPAFAFAQRGMGKCCDARLIHGSVVLYTCTSVTVAATTSRFSTSVAAADSV